LGRRGKREPAKNIPWKEFGTPEDVAAAVAFLVSDGARYITSETLDVNGGLVMTSDGNIRHATRKEHSQ
jgi:3-oxoacyl-[acyl-carrier protein] reductase